MARIRTIKPEFFTSESVGALSWPARLTFAGLWTYVDDRGRAKDNPRAIRGALWPNDEETVSSADVNQFIEELVEHHMVCRYTVGIANYLHVINMRKHQTINKPSASKLPDCPIHNAPYPAPDEVTEDSGSTTGALPEPSGRTTGGNGSGSGSGSGKEVEGKRASKPRPRSTEAPTHFEITAQLAAWAADKGYTDVATPAETEVFLDHHRSKGSTFSNWDAAWRKWMTNAAKWSKPKNGTSSPPGYQAAAFANHADTSAFHQPMGAPR